MSTQQKTKPTFLMVAMCCFSVSALFFSSSFMLSFSEQIPRISSWCLLLSSSSLYTHKRTTHTQISTQYQIRSSPHKALKNLGSCKLGQKPEQDRKSMRIILCHLSKVQFRYCKTRTLLRLKITNIRVRQPHKDTFNMCIVELKRKIISK